MSFNPIVIPEKYKLPARGFLEALDKRLGGRQATAEFILEAGKPMAEAYLGVPVTRETAKLVLAAAIDAIYSDARTLPPEEKPKEEEAQPFPPVPDDFADITDWKGKSRGSWPVTVQVRNVRVEGDNLVWDEPKGQREARSWNVVKGKKSVNAETNLIIPAVKAAGSFDYLGVGQTKKTIDNLIINPAKGKPGTFPPWSPKRGDRVGFYISTISRDKNHTKMEERSNVFWLTWP